MTPEPQTGAQVAREFQQRVAAGARIAASGEGRHDPEVFLSRRYLPRHSVRLFNAHVALTDLKHDDALGFHVAYVQLENAAGRPSRTIYPRIIYKDSSLVWRVASHFIHDEDEYWIGKGDVRTVHAKGYEHVVTLEETTNLPFELQRALDEISRRKKRVRDDDAIQLVLREAPTGRLRPFADFTKPRREAALRFAIHGDKPIARFTRSGDPSTLRFARGFAPDFDEGVIEEWAIESRFFGGRLRKVRVLSENRRAQFLFFSSPTHTWLNPPQALTDSLSSYCLRTVDVDAPEDLAIPGFEYHDEGESQIPEGYVGDPHPDDPHRSDASAWLNALPVIQEFKARFRSSRSQGRGRR